MVLQVVVRACASNIGRRSTRSTVLKLNSARSFHLSNVARQQQQKQQKPLLGNR